LTNTGWANPVTESLPAAVPIKFKTEDFRIPENLGTVQELYHPEAQNSEKPFIVFIQDAHAILNAQQNIHRLIEYLQEKYGIHLVALEGGSGKLDPTLLKTFPDEIVKNKIMNSYLERGEVTGPEMAAIFGQSQGEYYGIENWGLYEENYAAYLKASGVKEELLENLNQIKTSLDQERKKVYSAKLSDFHNQTTSFHEERSHLVELLKYLSAMLKSEIASVVSLPRNDNSAFTEKRANNNSTVIARRPKADEAISEKYPHLALLLESVAAEDSMKEESLDASIRHMASALKAKMSGKLNMNDEMAFHKNYQAFVTGQMEPGMYLKFLMETGEKLKLKPKLTPLMMKLLGLQQTLSMIKGTKVFDELEAFILDLENGLITTPEERQIADQYRKLGLLKDLISLEATREQVAAYQKNPEDYNAVTKESRHSEPQQVLQRGEESLQAALNYYRVALERDGAFHQNLENLLKRRKAGAAIVLAGGFHSEGFEKELKEKGYPHAVIMPRIQSLAGRETYPELMQGKISYKDFLETTFYDAFARHSTLQLVGEWNEPDFRRNLKTWR
ncbi:MAG: hypothetical protein HYZ83_03520, partial [Candidatus Omnitrophica bacterium]|nr:hypothetical protein [Candidatus Omnitrophota bacterium]